MGRYAIKCDDCKRTFGTTDSMRRSAEGGRCASCKRNKMNQTQKSEKVLINNLIGSGFRRNRKGLINLNNTDDLARM